MLHKQTAVTFVSCDSRLDSNIVVAIFFQGGKVEEVPENIVENLILKCT
jgi:hypothetical protein